MENALVTGILILVLCFCHVYSLELQTIGIFSLCKENDIQDEFTQYAHAMELFIDKRPKINVQYWSLPFRPLFFIFNSTSYKSFDVCYDMEKLTSVLTGILLNSTYYAIDESASWEVLESNRKTMTWQSFANHTIIARRSSTIVRITAHVPHDMLQTIVDIMSIEKHLAVTVHSPYKKKEEISHAFNFFDMKTQYGDLKRYLIKKQWKDVLILQNETSDDFYTSAFIEIVRLLKNMDRVCIKIHKVYSEDILRKSLARQFLKTTQSNHLIVIDVGTPYGVGIYNIKENESYFQNLIEIDLFFKQEQVQNEYLRLYYKRPRVVLLNTLRTEFSSKKEFTSRFKNNEALENKMQNFRSTLERLFESTGLFTRISIPLEGTIDWSVILQGSNDEFHSYFGDESYHDMDFETGFPNTVTNDCFQPVCLEGEEKLFGNIPKESALWDEEIGYFCQQCQQNYIKQSIGDAQCQPCTGYFVSNKQRTECVDPLQPVHHMLTNTSGIITLTICLVGGIFCSSALVIFIKYRQTPVVKLSDFSMSIIHMLVILSYFCSAPVVYFMTPTTELCMARTLLIALLYNLNTSIVFTKSMKLLKAFSKNIRSTKNEVLRTQLSQTFIILINLLSAISLVVAFWSSQHPQVSVRKDFETTQKFLYCSNGHKNVAISGLMLLLHLACFIQAFRCRKLPGHLNEAMNIAYASFINTVSLSVMFPIFFSQKFEEDGEIVVVFVLTGNSLILFLFLYVKKLFTIIFKPDKNTREYFKMKHLEAMKDKARRLGAKPNNNNEIKTVGL